MNTTNIMKKLFYFLSIAILLSVNTFAQQSISTIQAYWKNRVVPPVAQVNETFGSYWNLLGNAPATSTNFIGTTNAQPLVFKTNNIQRFSISDAGYFKFGIAADNSQTTISDFRISNSATSILDIGDGNAANSVYMWANRPGSKTLSNFNIYMDDKDMSLNDSSSIQFRHNNVLAFALTNPAYSPTRSDFAQYTPASFQKSTLQESRCFRMTSRTQGFAVGGTLATQRVNIWEPVTYTAAANATITNAYNNFFFKGIAGTSVTIPNNWGFGTDGSAHITQSIVIGAAAKTPIATIDVTGSSYCSGTSTIGGVLSSTGINNTGALTTSTTFSCGTNFTCTGTSLHTGASTFVAALTGSNSIQSTSKTGGVGYAVGSGSTVTQVTSRTTGVTINAITGAITLFSAAGSASWQSFTVTNSAVTAKDVIIVNQQTGTDLNLISVTNVAAGSFRISFATTGGTTLEAPVFNFVVIKGQTN